MFVKNKFSCRNQQGFTLMELLTVIAIIGILTAFTIPVLKSVSRTTKIARVKSEMQQIETELDSYKAQYGVYPQGNGTGTSAAVMNQLYYELSGVTNVTVDSKPCYQTLDEASIVGVAFFTNLFHVRGALNCFKGSGEDVAAARNFFYDLKPNQIGSLPMTNSFGGYAVNFLVTSVGGPDASYQPMGFPGLNPFRYVPSSPANNNSGSYDLWIQLVINGKTNLICNWDKTVVLNSPLP